MATACTGAGRWPRPRLWWRLPFGLVLSLCLLLLAGCSPGPERPYVRLGNLDPTLAGGVQGGVAWPLLRVGLVSEYTPQETLLRYGPLIDHLGKVLGRHVELVLPKSLLEANELVRTGGVHLSLVSSYGYILGREEFDMEPLVVPVYAGQTDYEAYIVVRRYSGVIKFEHLKGHSFAYTDPLSATGRLYPETLIRGLGEGVGTFFTSTIFTGSDAQSLQALDQGLVDGAAVARLVFEEAVAEDPDLGRRVLVIERSDPLGPPPFVVSPRVGSNLKAELKQFFLTLHETPEGQELLEQLRISHYAEPDADTYKGVEELAAQRGGVLQ